MVTCRTGPTGRSGPSGTGSGAVGVIAYHGRMRLGILVVDTIDEPHRSVGGDYTERFVRLFDEVGATVQPYDGRAASLPDPLACDGWIVPGSRCSAFDDLDWIHRLQGWLVAARASGAPLIGICFGHQLIAQAFGGEVVRWPDGWGIGAVDYEVLDGTGDLRLIASHQDQVVRLPPGAELLARSEACPVAGYRLGERVICLQGHPEFDAALARSLYSSRRDLVGADVVDAALATLDRPLTPGPAARLLASVLDGARQPGA